MEFFDAVSARRSIREFLAEPMPDEVIQKALEAATLAPNSFNMQTWKFYVVRNPDIRKGVIKSCLNQTAARTSQQLIVAVADTSLWKAHNAKIIQNLENAGAPKRALDYYRKLIPFVYGWQLFAPIKWLFFNFRGLYKPTPRQPWSPRGRDEVAIKSCALACAHFMLAIAAQGYDTCPMEGFDSVRLKKLLNLNCSSDIVMVIAAGKRAPTGVWGQRFRLPLSETVHVV